MARLELTQEAGSGATPSGTSIVTRVVGQRFFFKDYFFDGVYSAVTGYFPVNMYGSSAATTNLVAELDSATTPGFMTIESITGPSIQSEVINPITYNVNVTINPTVSGSGGIDVTETYSGLKANVRLFNHPDPIYGQDTYISSSSVTISSAGCGTNNWAYIGELFMTNPGSTRLLSETLYSGATLWGVTPSATTNPDYWKIPQFNHNTFSSGLPTYFFVSRAPSNSGNSRYAEYLFAIVGDTMATSSRTGWDSWLNRIVVTQEAGSGATPTEKDIEIAQAAFEIESGSSTTSISVGSSGCTYSGFSYTTGGSFSVTATTGVGSAIVFSFPENDTPVARTGYAYMTYYDTDGNAYQQTITITQEPASDDPEGTSISHPVNGHFVPGMLKLRTTIENGKVYTTGNASLYPGLGYYKQVKCAPYILYYLNSYGGWDAFVIEGTVIKRDSITSYMTDRSYKNTTLQFETNKYTNEIKTSYELNTGLLSDEESANVAKNLVGSLKVYMHNLQEGWIKPVIITDSSVTYQTYETNGKKLSQYRINITESQSKLRK